MAVPVVKETLIAPISTTLIAADQTADTGITSSGSSITSSASNNIPSADFSATTGAWVSSAVNPIRSLPVRVADEAVADVKAIFDFNPDPAANVRPVPKSDRVLYALARFRAIVTDVDKLNAFAAVLYARNANYITKGAFYDALPANLERAIQVKIQDTNSVFQEAVSLVRDDLVAAEQHQR